MNQALPDYEIYTLRYATLARRRQEAFMSYARAIQRGGATTTRSWRCTWRPPRRWTSPRCERAWRPGMAAQAAISFASGVSFTVVRRNSRRSAMSNLRPRCRALRLSQITRSPTCHWWA